jgi:hypothetical protein
MAYSAGYVVGKIKASKLNSDFAFVAPFTAYKTADESVSSQTLQNDDHLVIQGDANAVYAGWCFVGYLGDTTGDMQYRFTFPTSDFLWSPMRVPTTASVSTGTTPDWGGELISAGTSTSTVAAGGSGQQETLWSSFTWMVGSTDGSLQLQWARNVASGTALVVKKGSFLIAHRLA